MRWQNLITRNYSASNCFWFLSSDFGHLIGISSNLKLHFWRGRSAVSFMDIFYCVFTARKQVKHCRSIFTPLWKFFSLSNQFLHFSSLSPSLPTPYSHVTPLFVSFTTLFPLHFYLFRALCLSHTNEPGWLACVCVCVPCHRHWDWEIFI